MLIVKHSIKLTNRGGIAAEFGRSGTPGLTWDCGFCADLLDMDLEILSTFGRIRVELVPVSFVLVYACMY